MFKLKAEGAFIRWQKWLEQGEQMCSYFFKLEKAQARYNSILQLNVDGTVTDNKKDISTFCHNYYSSLYKSKFDKCDMFDFF